jgi:hypothetical protein
MPVTKIRGNTQIQALTITNAEIATNAAIATTKLADGVEFLQRSGSVALTGNLNANSNRITNLSAPVSANDAARLIDVQGATAGLVIKDVVRVATTADINLAVDLEAGDSIDGVVLVAGDRVLVKNQTTASLNGIYVASASGAAVRASDFDTSAEAKPNSFMFVSEGTTLADTGWVMTTNGPITLGTTNLTFIQFSGAGSGITSASNTGVSGVGVFKQAVSSNLEFYKIESADTKATFSIVATDRIQLQINQANIDHNSLLNYDIGQHRVINDGGSSTTELWSSSKISTELALKRNTALPSAQIWVGNGSGQSAPVTMTGDVTISNTGVTTVASTIQRTANIVMDEVPSGTIDGSNASFTLANTPLAGKLLVFKNGQKMFIGASNDYTLSGAVVSFVAATIPLTGDTVQVTYIY